MCLRVQPICNACEHLAKTEELYQCSDSGACSPDFTEVIKRSLSLMEFAETLCGNPDCSLNPGRLESLHSWLWSKVFAMQQQQQPSLMRSRWAEGNEVAQRNPNNSLSPCMQLPLPSTFAAMNNGFSSPLRSNASGGSFTGLSVPFDNGVTDAVVASQTSSGWNRKLTITDEESGNAGTCSGAFMEFG